MGFRLRCPDCRQAFPWQPTAEWPRFCPLCSADIKNDRADDDVVMPFIRSNEKTRRTDQVYRDIEAASEQRVHQAAAMAGVDASEMQDLKITDMRDSVIGQPSVAPVDNAITQHMARTHSDGWNSNARESYGPGISTGDVIHNGRVTKGIAPRAGVSAMTQLQQALAPIPGTPAIRS